MDDIKYSKRKLFSFSTVGFALQLGLVLFSYSTLYDSCYGSLSCQENFLNLINILSPYLHLFIPLFLISLLTLKAPDSVNKAWIRFAYVWIPVSIILIFLAPEYSHDWMYPIEKGTVAFASSLIFVFISIIIIGWKAFSTRQVS